MKKILKVCIPAVLVVFLIYAGVRIYRINKLFPQATVTTYEFGETAYLLGAEITVNSFEMGEPEDFGLERAYDDQRILVADVTIYNPSDEAVTVGVFRLNLNSGAWTNSIPMNYYAELNPDASSYPSETLASGESMNLRLPYSAISSMFRENEWNNLADRQFYLVVVMYPAITYIAVQ